MFLFIIGHKFELDIVKLEDNLQNILIQQYKNKEQLQPINDYLTEVLGENTLRKS